MLFFVEAAEIREKKARLLLFENVDIERGAAHVAGNRIIVAVRVSTKRLLGFGEETRRRKRSNEFAIFGVFRAPVLGDIESNVGSNGRGPVNAGGNDACLCCGIPKSGYLDIFGVPVPAAHILAERIEW